MIMYAWANIFWIILCLKHPFEGFLNSIIFKLVLLGINKPWQVATPLVQTMFFFQMSSSLRSKTLRAPPWCQSALVRYKTIEKEAFWRSVGRTGVIGFFVMAFWTSKMDSFQEKLQQSGIQQLGSTLFQLWNPSYGFNFRMYLQQLGFQGYNRLKLRNPLGILTKVIDKNGGWYTGPTRKLSETYNDWDTEPETQSEDFASLQHLAPFHKPKANAMPNNQQLLNLSLPVWNVLLALATVNYRILSSDAIESRTTKWKELVN